MTAVYNQVYGIIGGIEVKFPGYPESQKNSCSLGMKCPGTSGDVDTEKVELPVASSYPSVSFNNSSFLRLIANSITIIINRIKK